MKIGTVVKSRAGRDKEGWFVVLEMDGDFAIIADGKSRPTGRPKRKRKKHLMVTNTVLETADYATNRVLKKSLSKFGVDVEKEGNDLGKG